MYIFENDGYNIVRFSIEESDNNFNYILYCKDTGQCAVIDPLDPYVLLDFIRKNYLSVSHIINTHAHPDHIKGNNSILKVTLSRILIHEKGFEYVAPRARVINEGDLIPVGNINLKVLHTPGHCPEHVSLLVDNNIFVGDTLFLSGCGNTRFRGNPEDLYESIAFKLKTLPDDTRVFCGHDYAEKNLNFALDLDPGNTAAERKLEEVQKANSDGNEGVISTIGEEKQYNPFMRFDDQQVVKNVLKRDKDTPADPKSVFVKIRELRNSW